jgi:glycosyltransferase involved in cell wall biosynthesis
LKIIVDALGCPEQSGGMRLYVQELIQAWAAQYVNDQLIVVGRDWVVSEFQRWDTVKAIRVPNESIVTRVLGQFFLMPYLYHRKRPDILLSISPIVSPFVGRNRRMCVVHDWRHLKNGSEFGFLQRSYRKLWQTSVNWAGVTIAISQKTAEETCRLAPRANVRVVENGRDHASRWSAVPRPVGQPLILTFGHHSNKRPQLVIRALGILRGSIPSNTVLLVLGARGECARELKQLAQTEGVEQQCEFPGFVEELEYQRLIQRSSMIVLASSDEGFGLPVTEAQYFGIPLICTNDSGLESIHGPDLLVADPTPESIAQRILDGFRIGPGESSCRPLRNTWTDVAREIRSLALESLSRDFESRAMTRESA